MYQILEKKKKNPWRNSPEMRVLARPAWGAYSRLPDPTAKFNFSCLRRSLLGAFTRVVPLALIASPLKLWAITVLTVIPKFKNRSHDSSYALLT